MKRSQFGLRLMLLVVALFAVIFGWLRASIYISHSDREFEIMNLRAKIQTYQAKEWDAREVQEMKDPLRELGQKE